MFQNKKHTLERLTFAEMNLFVMLARTKSIRELARRLKRMPGQISKSLKKIEQCIGEKLIDRSIRGVSLTPAGVRVLASFQEILAIKSRLLLSAEAKDRSTLSIGSTTFLTNNLLTKALSPFCEEESLRLRFLEIPPDQFTNAALKSSFEMAFHFEELEWWQTWYSEKVGDIRWNLYASRTHPIHGLKKITRDEILKYSFVLPSYWTHEGYIEGEDQCPIPRRQRKVGSETSTAEAALFLTIHTHFLAYLPDILIRMLSKTNEVRMLQPTDLGGVSRPLFCSVRSAAMPVHLFKKMIHSVRKELNNSTLR